MAARCALAPFQHACHPFALLAWRLSLLEQAALLLPIVRLLDGFAALSQVEDLHTEPLSPGAWCTCAPIWLNPLMLGEEGRGLDVEFADLASSGINIVAGLAAAALAVIVASDKEEPSSRDSSLLLATVTATAPATSCAAVGDA